MWHNEIGQKQLPIKPILLNTYYLPALYSETFEQHKHKIEEIINCYIILFMYIN